MNGVNLDPLNPAGRPTPQELKAAGFTWARLVSRPGIDSYLNSLLAAGLKVLAVIARESDNYVIPGATLYQIGNEPDSTGPSSWTLSPAEYLVLWAKFRAEYPELPAITAGLSSGQLTWWAEVAPKLQGVQGFAVHPYAKDAIDARTLLKNLKAISPALPLWVTEWNRPLGEVAEFAAMLATETAGSMYFCWSDGMVPGFGLTPDHKALFAALAPKEPAPMTVSVNVTKEMVAKLKAVGDYPILNSLFRAAGTGKAELTQGTKGLYIASPADDWILHGPFDGVL